MGFVPFTKRSVLRKKPKRYFWFVHYYYLAAEHSQDFRKSVKGKRHFGEGGNMAGRNSLQNSGEMGFSEETNVNV